MWQTGYKTKQLVLEIMRNHADFCHFVHLDTKIACHLSHTDACISRGRLFVLQNGEYPGF